MTDAPLTAAQREAIRRTARARAQQMGLPVRPDPDAPPAPVEMPTDNLFALRGLLRTGRLTAAQQPVARRMLADAEAAARETESTHPTSGDAA